MAGISLESLQKSLRDQTPLEDVAAAAKVYLEEIARRLKPGQEASIPVAGGKWVFVSEGAEAVKRAVDRYARKGSKRRR